ADIATQRYDARGSVDTAPEASVPVEQRDSFGFSQLQLHDLDSLENALGQEIPDGATLVESDTATVSDPATIPADISQLRAAAFRQKRAADAGPIADPVNVAQTPHCSEVATAAETVHPVDEHGSPTARLRLKAKTVSPPAPADAAAVTATRAKLEAEIIDLEEQPLEILCHSQDHAEAALADAQMYREQQKAELVAKLAEQHRLEKLARVREAKMQRADPSNRRLLDTPSSDDDAVEQASSRHAAVKKLRELGASIGRPTSGDSAACDSTAERKNVAEKLNEEFRKVSQKLSSVDSFEACEDGLKAFWGGSVIQKLRSLQADSKGDKAPATADGDMSKDDAEKMWYELKEKGFNFGTAKGLSELKCDYAAQKGWTNKAVLRQRWCEDEFKKWESIHKYVASNEHSKED
ncbi:unnamed protein product, partial [Prorocentrum cordatum]